MDLFTAGDIVKWSPVKGLYRYWTGAARDYRISSTAYCSLVVCSVFNFGYYVFDCLSSLLFKTTFRKVNRDSKVM